MANRKRAIIVGVVVGAAFLLLGGGGFITFAVVRPLVLGAAVGVVAYVITRRWM